MHEQRYSLPGTTPRHMPDVQSPPCWQSAPAFFLVGAVVALGDGDPQKLIGGALMPRARSLSAAQRGIGSWYVGGLQGLEQMMMPCSSQRSARAYCDCMVIVQKWSAALNAAQVTSFLLDLA